MRFDIFHVNGIFYTRLNGELDASSLATYYETLTSHNEWKNSSKILSDETDLTYKNIEFTEIQRLTLITTSFKDKFINSSIAIYVESDLNFGMARMWQAYAESDCDVKVCVFKSYEEARSWLMEQ